MFTVSRLEVSNSICLVSPYSRRQTLTYTATQQFKKKHKRHRSKTTQITSPHSSQMSSKSVLWLSCLTISVIYKLPTVIKARCMWRDNDCRTTESEQYNFFQNSNLRWCNKYVLKWLPLQYVWCTYLLTSWYSWSVLIVNSEKEIRKFEHRA